MAGQPTIAAALLKQFGVRNTKGIKQADYDNVCAFFAVSPVTDPEQPF